MGMQVLKELLFYIFSLGLIYLLEFLLKALVRYFKNQDKGD